MGVLVMFANGLAMAWERMEPSLVGHLGVLVGAIVAVVGSIIAAGGKSKIGNRTS